MDNEFNDILLQQMTFVKALIEKGEKDNNKEISLYRHNNSGKLVVKIDTKDDPDIYRILQTVKSKYIPKIYGVYENGNGYSIIEEYIVGYSIQQRLKDGVFSKRETQKIIKELCCALNVLHNLGIIHRDIKPSNIIISETGDIKLIDFDISKIHKVYKSSDTVFLGTTGYVAPEMGITQSDARTDIYAIGVLINMMLTGKHPAEKLCKGSFSKIVSKCTHAIPSNRFTSVEELYNKL